MKKQSTKYIIMWWFFLMGGGVGDVGFVGLGRGV